MRKNRQFDFKRMVLLFSVALLFALLVLDLGLAWQYNQAFLEPPCFIPPLPTDRDVQALTITTSDGAALPVWYTPPKNGAVIIVLGGMEGALGGIHPPVDFLIEAGYGIVQVASRTCASPARLVTIGGAEAEDLIQVVDLLVAEGIDPERIGAFGFSMGGAAAAMAASQDTRIAAVVSDGNYANYGEDIAEPGSAFIEKVFTYPISWVFWLRTGYNPWALSPVEALPNLSPRPVLLIFGEEEAANGHAEEQYAAAQEPKAFWLVPGGSHGNSHTVASEEYELRVLKFFDEWLLGAGR